MAKAHFGNIARDLRSERGWSQGQLADAVGVSEATIQRSESEAARTYRAATAVEVLTKLHAHLPVPEDKARRFLVAGGLTEDFIQRLKQMAPAQAADTTDPHRARAQALLDHLCHAAGVDRVIAALETLSAGWGFGVPPPVVSGPQRLLRETFEEGHSVREYTPVQPPTAPRSRARKAEEA
jgi:transcriptional regulator with XRE-family HTH domain